MTDNLRALAEARSKRRGGGGGEPPLTVVGGRPVVELRAGELAHVVDEAEDALLRSGARLYQFGSSVVRVVWAKLRAADGGDTYLMRLSAMSVAGMTDVFSKTIAFERWSERAEKMMRCDPPAQIAEVYLSRDGGWRLPVILGVVTAPTLRPDGTVLDEPGFDEATGILFDPRGVDFPRVPATPSRDDGIAALAEIERLMDDFPLVTPVDRSVALSGVLTTVIRRALPVAPMHAFSAPEPGSGKSMLVDIAAKIATGEVAAVTSTGRDKFGDAELEKRLVSSMLAADAVVSLDNLEQPLGGAFLCQLMTQQIVKLRPLGRSVNVVVPNTTSFFATGNNLTVAGDMTRRVLQANLDAGVERPELREFDERPLDLIAADRGRYVLAALTAVRSFIAAGSPRQRPPLGSYEAWSTRVRDCLIWLGRPDPVDAIEGTRKADPSRANLVRILTAWRDRVGVGRNVFVKDLAAEAAAEAARTEDGDEPPGADLGEALAAVARGERGAIDTNRLAQWLKKNQGRVVTVEGGARVKVEQAGLSHGAVIWVLTNGH